MKTDFDRYRAMHIEGDNYLQVVTFCQCGRVYCTEWQDHLAKRELRYDRPPLQEISTSKLEQKCCPDITTPQGIEYYWVNTEYALRYSDLEEPVLITTFTCPGCGEDHPILLDGRHRLYRALMEGQSCLPAYHMGEGYECSCTERSVA
jgi:hypothetical protein